MMDCFYIFKGRVQLRYIPVKGFSNGEREEVFERSFTATQYIDMFFIKKKMQGFKCTSVACYTEEAELGIIEYSVYKEFAKVKLEMICRLNSSTSNSLTT